MNSDSGQVRLFTAIPLPDEWLFALGKVRSALERVGGTEFKWVRTELMHITVVFLGYQDSDSVSAITSALDAAAAKSSQFPLKLGQLGAFGPPHGLNVLWAGLVQTPDELLSLHNNVSTELGISQIPFDRKPLVPHITLARGRRPMNREVSLRVATELRRATLPPMSARIGEFVLMRSILSPKGPSYEVVERFRLGELNA